MAVANYLKSIIRFKFLALMLALVMGIANTSALAVDRAKSESPYFIDGYDLVSYFAESGPVRGNTAYSLERGDKTLLFSSEENLAAFIESPDSYLPAYNGNSAYGMVYGMQSKVDPLEYDIVDGRLYLQLDGGTKNRWNRRVSRNIKKADRVWRKMMSPSENRR